MAPREKDPDFNPYAAPLTTSYAAEETESGAITAPYAEFGTRFVAVFIDGLITGALGFVLGLIVGFIMVSTGVNPAADGPQLALNLLGIFVGWLYEAGMISSSSRATLGKMAMGITVTDLEGRQIGFGRATGRYFAKFLSAIILLIGYIMQQFTAKRQALHDILAGTLVFKTR